MFAMRNKINRSFGHKKIITLETQANKKGEEKKRGDKKEKQSINDKIKIYLDRVLAMAIQAFISASNPQCG